MVDVFAKTSICVVSGMHKYAVLVLGFVPMPPYHYVGISSTGASSTYQVSICPPYHVWVFNWYGTVSPILPGSVWYGMMPHMYQSDMYEVLDIIISTIIS